MTISKQMLNVIEKTADTAVFKFAKMNKVQDINYYKKTERLLYVYPALTEIIKSTYIDIDELIQQGVQLHSKDIVRMPKANEGVKQDIDDVFFEKIETKKDNLRRTEIDVQWIERALSKLSKEDMIFIELKYFKNLSLTDIAEHLYCSESTVKRVRRKVITTLSINLFGSIAIIM